MIRITRTGASLRRTVACIAAMAVLVLVTFAPPANAGTSGVLFGSLVAPNPRETFGAALTREDATFGPLPISRVFYTGAVEQWPGKAGLSGRPVVVSFKYLPAEVLSGADDAALRQFFAGAPTTYDVWWSYIHEPENDVEAGRFTPAAYRAAWQHIADLAVAAAPTNTHLHATLILMCYTLRAASLRDWHDYYVPTAQSLIAYDCYNHLAKTGQYSPPSTFFGPLTDWSKANPTIPWAVAEVGSLLLATDPTGSQRASWLRSVGAFLVAQHANPMHSIFGIYFDVRGAKGSDYRLLDQPSQTAWREVVQTY